MIVLTKFAVTSMQPIQMMSTSGLLAAFNEGLGSNSQPLSFCERTEGDLIYCTHEYTYGRQY